MRILEDRRPKKPEVVVEETRYVESDTRLMQRLLGREVGGKQNILVLNDEAHHAYRIRRRRRDDAEEDAECARTRSAPTSSRTSRRSGSTASTASTSNRRINFCVDLSATPYYLARAGEDTNRVFPWVVSDFGLTDAIESGLVKIPQLAHSDPTGEEQAAYFNIWRWIMSKLTAAERGGKRANPKPEAVLQWAEQPIRAARVRLGASCARRGRGTDEERPPVLILVCKNTKLAAVIYDWLAEGKAPAGIPPADLAALRNVDGKQLHDPRRLEGDRRDRGRGREERRVALDAPHARHRRQARLAARRPGAARLPGGLRGARAEARPAAASARAATCAASSASGCSPRAGTATRSRTSSGCARSCRSSSASRSSAAACGARATT